MIALTYLALAAISSTIWPRSHRRRWTIVVKAATWPVWLLLFGGAWLIDEMENS